MDPGERPPSDEPDDVARDDEQPDGADESPLGSADETRTTDPATVEDSAGGESADTSESESADTSESESADTSESESADTSESRSPGATDDRNLLSRFRHDQDGPLMWLREMLSSAAIVLVIGLVIFSLSGVWPPMVAVESPSMEPNMNTGDLVFVTEPGRFAPDAADNDIGVVTYERGQEADYRSFSSYGSVIIYQPPNRRGSPIIHRAMLHVEEGENWYERADERYHTADGCEDLRNCPAPHDGYITLGDNNGQYDQVNGLADPVKEEWVTGVARLRVPYLGYVRLLVTGQATVDDLLPAVLPVDAELVDPAMSDPVSMDPGVSSGTPALVAG